MERWEMEKNDRVCSLIEALVDIVVQKMRADLLEWVKAAFFNNYYVKNNKF